MDESAVSSDPVIAFLLDEVVVKDWCKRTFKNIIRDVRGICILVTHAFTFFPMLLFVSASFFYHICLQWVS